MSLPAPMRRRQVLRMGGAVAAGSLQAGCLSRVSGGGSRWSCPEANTPAGAYFDMVHLTDPVWEMTAEPNPVALNEELTVRLENVSNEPARTWGSTKMTAIQLADGDDWVDVSYFPDLGWGDAGATHEPGEGWEWSFRFARDAIEEVGRFSICAELVPGTYRFVYWGIQRGDDQYAMGAEFEVTSE